jgi:hypothetical protein
MPSMTSACGTLARAARSGIALQTYEVPANPSEPPEDFAIVGLVPDGWRTVTVKVGAHPARVSVSRNVYSLDAKEPISEPRGDRNGSNGK